MKIFFAGGEGLPRTRQKQMFSDGVRYRLVSFFTGQGPCNKVVDCAKEWEKDNVRASNPPNENEPIPS